MPNTSSSSKKCHRGGSAASDAVVNAVPAPAFDKMNTMFDNVFSSSSQKGGATRRKVCKHCGKLNLQNHQCNRRGGTEGVAYNYDGMIKSTAIVDGTPVRAVHISPASGGKSKSAHGLRHISDFSDSSSYKLRNRLIGGETKLEPLPIDLKYPVTTVADKTGPAQIPLTTSEVLGEMKVDSVVAPMTKTTVYGLVNNDLTIPFKYGGGLTKKIVMAVAAKHLVKKAVKAVKKMKGEKKQKQTSPAPKSKPSAKSSKPKPKTSSKKTSKK